MQAYLFVQRKALLVELGSMPFVRMVAKFNFIILIGPLVNFIPYADGDAPVRHGRIQQKSRCKVFGVGAHVIQVWGGLIQSLEQVERLARPIDVILHEPEEVTR